jgi:hypothetical protein
MFLTLRSCKKPFYKIGINVKCKIVKTGPVEPGIGPASGPVNAEKRTARESEKKPLKPKKLGKIGELAGSSGLAVEDFFFSSYFQYDLH